MKNQRVCMKSNHQNDTSYENEQEQVVDQEQIQVTSEENKDVEQCLQDVAMWKDQASRIFADFDNYKKRMEREQASWMQTAQLSVLKDLLPIVDNFDRALLSKTDSTVEIYAGIEMIYKSVMHVLHKYGVKEFANYQEFDPEFHEALMDIESADHQAGQIVQVLEKGFMIKDKVLRPAKVMIAK